MWGIRAVTAPPNVAYSKGNDDASHTYLTWESDLKKKIQRVGGVDVPGY